MNCKERPSAKRSTKKILIFCDPGIDDAVALLYAHIHPEIDIVGIVASYGNTTRENAIRNVIYLHELFDMKHVPIFSGADGPFTGKEVVEHIEIHGVYGLGKMNIPAMIDVEPFENFFDVIDVIKRYKNELTILTTGRLTSLATLYVFYPGLMQSSVKEVVSMSGAFFVPGNITPLAEANVYEDPIAANLVISLVPKITMIPLNVTNELLVPMEIVHDIAFTNGFGIFEALLEYYYAFYQASTEDELIGTPIHDVVAASALVNPHFFEYKSYRVYVESMNSETAGTTFPDIRRLAELPPAPEHLVAVDVDNDAFLEDFIRILTLNKNVNM